MPPKARGGWSAGLTRVIEEKDSRKLSTLADARAFILEQPAYIQQSQSWQRAAQLLLDAADDPSAIEAATKPVQLALFLEMRLKLR